MKNAKEVILDKRKTGTGEPFSHMRILGLGWLLLLMVVPLLISQVLNKNESTEKKRRLREKSLQVPGKRDHAPKGNRGIKK